MSNFPRSPLSKVVQADFASVEAKVAASGKAFLANAKLTQPQWLYNLWEHGCDRGLVLEMPGL
jgi:hypothetical protein